MIEKFPHKIKYNSKISYTVSFVPKFDDPTQVGACDPNTKEIKIMAGMTDEKTVSTAFHESIHQINFEELDLCLVERQVEILEIELVKLFRRNPKFFDLFIDLVRKKL